MVNARKMFEKRYRVVAVTVGVILVVSLTLFVVGLVFITNKCEESAETLSNTDDLCKPSEEAIRSGLIDLLANVRQNFSKTCPCAPLPLSHDNIVPSREYVNPTIIKDTTDRARSLYKQLKSLIIDELKLTPQELKSLAEVEHFLSHNFGQPEEDYYTGSWLLGPNIMCGSGYMCRWFKRHVIISYSIASPLESLQDIIKIRKAFEFYNKTVYQYMDNIRYGVQSGMVRSKEGCLAGLDAIKAEYINIAESNATGILQERFVQRLLLPAFYTKVSKETKEKWFKTYGKSVNESILEFLVEYIGKALEKLLWFLEYEHMLYCVPSSISSGLANLPLSHIYYNGTKTDKTTTPFLPTGEKLSGKVAYEKLLAFHTTTNLTANEVYTLGWKHVNILYPQILELVKNVTGHLNESQAKESFKNRLADRSQYYNKQPFPQNESFAEAKKNCHGIAKAKKFCPKRWEALQIWFDEEAKLLSELDPKTHNLFHFTGQKRTTPNCPIKLVPSFKPLSALSYRGSTNCMRSAEIALPFLNDNYGPRYQGLSINSHEGRPGHHTQVQGYLENFESSCSRDDAPWLDRKYSAFTEGWGLYAEYPLVAELTDAYENDPLSRYGMLKGQIWRALRLVVDSGFHFKEIKRDEALDLFGKYMWDTSDIISKEITRYQSIPGQASSYKIGQLTIIDLQEYARKELGEKFKIREFHYELLRHGSVPLDYIKYQVKKYVDCVKNNADCKNSQTAASNMVSKNSDFDLSDLELYLYEMSNRDRYY